MLPRVSPSEQSKAFQSPLHPPQEDGELDGKRIVTQAQGFETGLTICQYGEPKVSRLQNKMKKMINSRDNCLGWVLISLLMKTN